MIQLLSPVHSGVVPINESTAVGGNFNKGKLLFYINRFGGVPRHIFNGYFTGFDIDND
jgi:hypothetical protein